ncbi:MAG TPA: L,D-transpeptidase [Polyangiaceae bacterium]|nr:L,D-transpeptidase [Polyangiaceae bacterium]
MTLSTVFRTLRILPPALALAAGLIIGCKSDKDAEQSSGRSDESPSTATAAAVTTRPEEAADVHGASRHFPGAILVMESGAGGEREERWLSAEAATAAGYTIVDMNDDWTPFLFEELVDPAGHPLPNRYRRVFIGLANDELDGDGQPLEAGQSNYLELYGIFPSLSVIRDRFMLDEKRTCVVPEDQAAMAAQKTIGFVAPATAKRNAIKQKKAGAELEQARLAAKVETLAELAQKQPKQAAKVAEYEKWAAVTGAVAAAERRLICEGFLPKPEESAKKKGPLKHEPGMQDEALRVALRSFQQKHMIYDGPSFRPRTLEMLAKSTLENDHAAFVRAFRERVIAAADVLEDGSTETKKGPVMYTSASGEKVPLRNLAEEYTKAALEQLGLDTVEGARAFFDRHDDAAFKHLRAGVKLGPRPEYYAPHMELSIVVDRGDVWYDPWFDEQDKWRYPPRSRYPSLTLYVDYRGEKFPLTRWRTTIGGWRAEQAANGYEYYKYKGSDTGARVIRKIVSGPVWIAPESTPIRSLVKSKKVEGRWQNVVNYDELGPGYLSAYGVVAGYFVIPGQGDAPDVDRGIRAHGSSNYLSIYSDNGYSHGCHRLPNHLAIRLYDFLLQHRHMIVKGDSPMEFSRQFLSSDQVYDMRIPSRGFEFELDPPISVNVLEGNVRSVAKEPIEGYVPKPGKRYPPPPPAEGEGETTAAAIDKGAP